MKTEVTALEIYTSLPVTELNTESGKGIVLVSTILGDMAEQVIEIEIREMDMEGESNYYAILSKEDALFLAKGIINLLKIIK